MILNNNEIGGIDWQLWWLLFYSVLELYILIVSVLRKLDWFMLKEKRMWIWFFRFHEYHWAAYCETNDIIVFTVWFCHRCSTSRQRKRTNVVQFYKQMLSWSGEGWSSTYCSCVSVKYQVSQIVLIHNLSYNFRVLEFIWLWLACNGVSRQICSNWHSHTKLLLLFST